MVYLRKQLFFLALFFIFISNTKAQLTITPQEGYAPMTGILVSMLDDLKDRITNDVKDLTQDEADFLVDENSNQIGALIMHLAATEYYYQQVTFFDTEPDIEKDEELLQALGLGDHSRNRYVGKPINYYLEKWDEVRSESKRLLKEKDDDWLLEIQQPGDGEYNYYFAWYHVMEHQAAHMGQISLIKNRMKGGR